MPIYTVTCGPCGWTGDIRTTFSENNVVCPKCTLTVTKESVYRLNFGGFARTPSEERDWSHDFTNFREANAELDYKKERLEDATQTRIAEPPLGMIGAARAQQMIAKGVTDLNDL